MSWQSLLASGKVQTQTTSKSELDDLRAVINRDLADASIVALSADRRFATAYSAALQTATMLIACSGYRTSSGAGHHKTTFEAAQLALGPTSATMMTYFDSCRRKRNAIDYDRAYVASVTEAEQILIEAQSLLQLAEAWIALNYPQFR